MNKEDIYVSISSSLIHAFFLVLALYLINKDVLINLFNKKYAVNANKNVSIYINSLTDLIFSKIFPETEENDLTNKDKEKNKLEIKKFVAQYVKENKHSILDNVKVDRERNKKKEEHNNKLYAISKYIIIAFGVALGVFLIGYYIYARKEINIYNSGFEILFSLILTIIILGIYEVYFIGDFVFRFIDYKIPKLLTNIVSLKF